MNTIETKYFYQDGAQFYDADTGARLMSLSSMVKGDHDMDGARAARGYFMKQRPEYRPEAERLVAKTKGE